MADEGSEAGRSSRSRAEAHHERGASLPPELYAPQMESGRSSDNIATYNEQAENRRPFQELPPWARSNNGCNVYAEGIAAGIKMQERLSEAERAHKEVEAGMEACQAALRASEIEAQQLSAELSEMRDRFICIACMDEPRSSLL